MKKFFEDKTKEMAPKVKHTFKKGHKMLVSIFNKIDFDLTRTIRILRDKQERLKQFIINRENMVREIERKENEVNQLREQIYSLKNSSNSEQLDVLRMELSNKLDDLLTSQQKYYELESKIEEEQKKVSLLIRDKQKLEQDRNSLKLRYDNVKTKFNANKKKTKNLEQELNELKIKEIHYEELLHKSTSKEELQHYEKQLEELQKQFNIKNTEYESIITENNQFKQDQIELEQRLLQKMSSLSKLSNELNSANIALQHIQEEKNMIKTKLQTKEKDLKAANLKITKLEVEVKQLKQLEKEYEHKYDTALKEMKKAESLLGEYQEDFSNDMISYEERLQELQNELVDKQNELSIVKAEKGEAENLSQEEKRVLEREFEPRFNVLYKNCCFHPEFLSDFFHITPSDRLKVEAAIVQLNYNYGQAVTNIRPSCIRARRNKILEYPFGTDSVGRIYFHIVHLHRLSRTKNGRGKLTQDNVIEWLIVNK
jgi:chromosome segregation ATPase